MTPPKPAAAHPIFDRKLARARLARALRDGGADFLLARAAGDLADRLAIVARQFPVALDLGTPGVHVARMLAGDARIAGVIRAAPLHEPAAQAWLTLVGDEERLPFGDARFDLIVSALSLHQVNDLPGALIQIRRALKPDGLFIACLAGGRTLTELRTALAAAEAEVDGGASPRVAPFADVRDIGGLLQRAGFALPVTDVDPVVVRYADLFGLMRDLRAMGATNALLERRRSPLKRAILRRAAEVYAGRFADPDGRVRATFELIWLSGWAPHPAQRKPLAPGSARTRLADALAKPQDARVDDDAGR